MAESSIVIVTYNGLREYTVPCLESIFRKTHGEDYEVIVVDNNSSDGTPAYLSELAGRDPRVKPVLNATNRGFAGGNNDGIRIASGKVIVLLNNDTLVSEGWLATMRSALLADRSVGLLGPVSNAVGNEQKIFTPGSTPADILAEGEQWSRHASGAFFETGRLGFFCVAFRRDVLETVGHLDEAYDLGFFEDDDYCLRVLKAGYRLVCREDVFIYHRGSASFGSVPGKTKELLKKNRCLLEKKFNIRYNPPHPRDRQLELVATYVLMLASSKDEAPLRFRINNRLQVINGLMPRGFFKRWRFKRRLSSALSGLK
jgi:GT2 family glycosyltransferase